MSVIKILPSHEALKIAAGEVIERPAHVVKELLENALDAGATTITLYIQDAGKQLIRLVDNGCGMSSQDAKLCFLPHATSKISSLDDLQTTTSFGFRGEALASIAAISKVILKTKPRDAESDQFGFECHYSNSTCTYEQEVGCPAGTDIAVHELFFNTPVRKRFLKQNETEVNTIKSVFYAASLAYPHIHFKFYNDTRLILNAPSVGTPADRALQLWDDMHQHPLLDLPTDTAYTGEQEKPAFKLSGFISDHTLWRYNKSSLYFFVNKRWVKNNELAKALLKGYLQVLPTDRFPIGLIFIDIAAELIDVNIHPKKEEVKFLRPGPIQTVLTNAVKKTLENHISSKLSPQANEQLKDQNPSDHPIMQKTISQLFTPRKPALQSFHAQNLIIQPPSNIEAIDRNLDMLFEGFMSTVSEDLVTTTVPIKNIAGHQSLQQPLLATSDQIRQQTTTTHTIIGQMFKMYIIIEKDDEIVVIDQHAAHERILYEQYAQSFYQAEGTILLFPEVVTLASTTQAQSLLAQKEFFLKQGVDFDAISNNQIAVRSCPPFLRGPSLAELLGRAAEFIEEYELIDTSNFSLKFNEFVHAQMACKAAVKAGDELTTAQMQKLITDLEICNNRLICVHNRPTTWIIKKSSIDKKFQRI